MISSLLICGTIVGIWVYALKLFQKLFILNKYKRLMDMLDSFLERSYNSVYSDQLIVYTSSGTTKIQQDEFETIQRNFIKLTFDLLGEFNTKNLCIFYGDKETLARNILIYFRQRLEKDEIVKIINTKTPK